MVCLPLAAAADSESNESIGRTHCCPWRRGCDDRETAAVNASNRRIMRWQAMGRKRKKMMRMRKKSQLKKAMMVAREGLAKDEATDHQLRVALHEKNNANIDRL